MKPVANRVLEALVADALVRPSVRMRTQRRGSEPRGVLMPATSSTGLRRK